VPAFVTPVTGLNRPNRKEDDDDDDDDDDEDDEDTIIVIQKRPLRTTLRKTDINGAKVCQSGLVTRLWAR
jgi:hypothetical protein